MGVCLPRRTALLRVCESSLWSGGKGAEGLVSTSGACVCVWGGGLSDWRAGGSVNPR